MTLFPIFITSFYILSKPWENKFTKCPVMASCPIFITSFNILSKPGLGHILPILQPPLPSPLQVIIAQSLYWGSA